MLPFEIPIRLAAFAGVLVMMAAWELIAPRRQQAAERPLRWSSNLGVVVIDTLLVRILVPTTAVGIALLAEERGWGLFHWLAVPVWFAVVVCFIALDLAIYLQHVLFHAVPALWRLHRMHHADPHSTSPRVCASIRSRSCCRC
jgi:sterol desaturase/sphingolipid hydroxylase (fatty acid hydroxylase superfamily)